MIRLLAVLASLLSTTFPCMTMRPGDNLPCPSPPTVSSLPGQTLTPFTVQRSSGSTRLSCPAPSMLSTVTGSTTEPVGGSAVALLCSPNTATFYLVDENGQSLSRVTASQKYACVGGATSTTTTPTTTTTTAPPPCGEAAPVATAAPGYTVQPFTNTTSDGDVTLSCPAGSDLVTLYGYPVTETEGAAIVCRAGATAWVETQSGQPDETVTGGYTYACGTAMPCACDPTTAYTCQPGTYCPQNFVTGCGVFCPNSTLYYVNTDYANVAVAANQYGSYLECDGDSWAVSDMNAVVTYYCLMTQAEALSTTPYASVGCPAIAEYACPAGDTCDFSLIRYAFDGYLQCLQGVMLFSAEPSGYYNALCVDGAWTSDGSAVPQATCVTDGTKVQTACENSGTGLNVTCGIGNCYISCPSGTTMSYANIPSPYDAGYLICNVAGVLSDVTGTVVSGTVTCA